MCTHHACIDRRRFLLASAAAGLLAACGTGESGGKPAVAIEIDTSSSCALDGMLLADYPGPKAQIHYEGLAQPDWFCDTVEMFSIHLNPEQARRVTAMYVQDMGKADWERPRGHWIDARSAVYVQGSRRRGSMGPTMASFSTEADARAFAQAWGGKVLRFNEVTPDMVVLDGGALHDQRM
ncbi:nitrous oxide reductase accessory protein NosL [Parazoarcus communis]|uniref:Nitrous oxide reductase accessory protein NosL n=1 Tax=Parazoarcus communis SWub3 = DSM 12120 TaxID=1121029 RepID=A0A323V095_9RHOO|nr:nitrous oxide reductase accessory protein NosL [Parazoarcus communis]NMG69585.1 twin-arginine translocation signal domain-containing protein [Parazoarcus communis SWub3 = DSM 12120]PZA17523.1 nitrous oxide reductase accessory protein NosL [Azoarcus communis] [Parazoarcus communis SWub3 = DSM 12120]